MMFRSMHGCINLLFLFIIVFCFNRILLFFLFWIFWKISLSRKMFYAIYYCFPSDRIDGGYIPAAGPYVWYNYPASPDLNAAA